MKNFITYSLSIIMVLALIPFASAAEFLEGTTESTDGLQIAYRVQGEGEPALVFIHGWLENQGFWDAQRESFAQSHKVVTLDLAGHGASGKERADWSIEAFGDDLVSVITALELQNAILIGHAAGASVALEAARKLPEQVMGVVGLDTFQDLKLSSTVEQQERILGRFKQGYAELTTRIIQSMFSSAADPALVEKAQQEMLSVPEEIGIATMQASMTYKMAPAVQSLSIPIRSINSDAFPTNVQGNKESATSYEVAIVPGGSHLFFLESPDEFDKVLTSVLQEISEYSTKTEEAVEAE